MARRTEDGRFVDEAGPIQSIVTSTGTDDDGLFQTDLRDERYLPFEERGAESRWTLELPATFRPFDFDSVTDVVLHVRYTARPGGAPLRDAAVAHLDTLVSAPQTSDLTLLFSFRHDFPTQWHQFTVGDHDFSATVTRKFFRTSPTAGLSPSALPTSRRPGRRTGHRHTDCP